jgi:uncharacterized GH25 family protein
MKKQTLIHAISVLFVVACSVMCATAALAHDTWAVMQEYTLSRPTEPVLGVVSSHLFTIPGKDYVAPDRVEKAFFLSPDGSESISASPAKEGFHARHALNTAGTYMAVVVSRPGFSSKTTEGYRQGKTKKDLKDVVSCSYSEKFSKALFTVGKTGGAAFSKPLGHSLEIVPLQDPSAMKVGEVMSVRVLFQGKPLPSTTVSGVYAGFSDDPGTFAYSTNTNKEGVARIKLIHNGPWLLLVKQKNAYPDTTVCDAKSYSSSLTFNVR